MGALREKNTECFQLIAHCMTTGGDYEKTGSSRHRRSMDVNCPVTVPRPDSTGHSNLLRGLPLLLATGAQEA